MPSAEEFAAMHAFNQQSLDSGVILHCDGLLASSKGARINFSESSEPTVKHGPFDLENLVAGYWKIQLDSIEQVIDWAKKIPFKKGSVEIRQVGSREDYGQLITEELKQ